VQNKIREILKPNYNILKGVARRGRLYWTPLILLVVSGVILVVMAFVAYFKLSPQNLELFLFLALGVGLCVFVFLILILIPQHRILNRDTGFLWDDLDIVKNLYQTYYDDKKVGITIEKIEVNPILNGFENSFFLSDDKFKYIYTTKNWYELPVAVYRGKYSFYNETIIIKKHKTNEKSTEEIIATLTPGNLIDHKSDFKSESIDFNKHFNVKGKDLIKITKLLTPSIIDKMVNLEPQMFKNKEIQLGTDFAKIIFSDLHIERLNRWDYGLADFRSRIMTVNGLIKKIILKVQIDLNIFEESKAALTPFLS
jgi:hypothetical protein